MESIIICNRINNNTGLKQTDTTGFLFRLFRETTEFDGEFYFFVFKQAGISHHVTAGFRSRETAPCASVLPMTGYQKYRNQNKTTQYSLEDGSEEFYNSD